MIKIIGLISENDYALKKVKNNIVCDISDYINTEYSYACSLELHSILNPILN